MSGRQWARSIVYSPGFGRSVELGASETRTWAAISRELERGKAYRPLPSTAALARATNDHRGSITRNLRRFVSLGLLTLKATRGRFGGYRARLVRSRFATRTREWRFGDFARRAVAYAEAVRTAYHEPVSSRPSR